MRPFIALPTAALVGLVTACSLLGPPDTLEGTWRYDTDRFDELAVVRRADARSAGTLGGLHGDDSERAGVLRALAAEAQTTTLVFTDDAVTVQRDGQTERVATRLVASEGDTLTLALGPPAQGQQWQLTREGGSLTVRQGGEVIYVLER